MTKAPTVVLRFAVAISCLIIFAVKPSTATEAVSRPYNLDADLEFILPDTIVVGETFQVTFNVKIKQSITHYNEVPDKISILLPRCCVLDSGQTEWHGRLDKGSVVSLVLRARAVHGCYEFFQGFVSAACSPSHSRLFNTRGRITSRYYRILGPSEVISAQPDSLSIRVADTHEPHRRLKLLPMSDSLRRLLDSNIHWQPREVKLMAPRNNQVLWLDSLRTLAAVISYFDSTENWLYIADNSQGDVVRRDSRLPFVCKSLTQGLEVERAQDRTCKITMEDGLNEGKVEIHIGTDAFIVTVKRRR